MKITQVTMKITQAGIASEILVIVDKIEKELFNNKMVTGRYRKLEATAKTLKETARTLVTD